MKEELFNDNIVDEYVRNKSVNLGDFTWWSFVNLKSDLQTALGFAKFFYPDIIEIDGCFLLKDKYYPDTFEGWKKDCNNDKTKIEKMMNLYEVGDFFHINRNEDENEDIQIIALGDILKCFWSLSFKDRFPDRKINVSVFQEDDGALFITVYELLE